MSEIRHVEKNDVTIRSKQLKPTWGSLEKSWLAFEQQVLIPSVPLRVAKSNRRSFGCHDSKNVLRCQRKERKDRRTSGDRRIKRIICPRPHDHSITSAEF